MARPVHLIHRRRLGSAAFATWGHALSVDVACDGRVVVVTWRAPSRITLWSPDGSMLLTIPRDRYCGRARFSPDGSALVISRSTSCDVLDSTTGALRHTLTDQPTQDARFSPDGTQIAVAQVGDLLLFDAASGAQTHRLTSHTGEINAVLFDADSHHVFSASADCSLTRTDPATRRTLTNPGNPPTALALTPDGQTLIIGRRAGVVSCCPTTLRGTNTRLGEHTDENHDYRSVYWVGASPDGETAYSFGRDQRLRAWSITGGQRWSVKLDGPARMMFVDAAVSPDGRLITVANATTALHRVTADGILLPPTTAPPSATSLSLSDTVLVSSDTRSERWARSGERLEAWSGGRAVSIPPHVVTQGRGDVCRHPGGALIARFHTAPGTVRGAHSLQGTSKAVIIRRVRDLAPVARLDLDENGRTITSPDGRLLAVRSHYTVTLYSLTDRQQQWCLPLGEAAIAFSPDNTRLAVVGDFGAKIVPVDSGTPVDLPGQRFGAGCRVVFLDDTRLAVAYLGVVFTWDGAWSRHSPPDAPDGGDPRQVSPIALSDATLATIGLDGCIHLWHAPGALAPASAPLTLPPDPAPLAGAVLCLSGTFTQIDKPTAIARIVALGGKVAKSPVKALTHQVYGLPKYSGPVKESSIDRKVRARIAAGADIVRWSESQLITALTPSPDQIVALLRADPSDFIAWMAHLGRQKVAGVRRLSLVDADLSGLDLRSVPLEEADLHGANLRGCDLSGIRPYRISLVGADLREANLRGSNIGQANLRGADLRGADLTDAKLFADLLAGTRLEGAILDGLTIQYSDLRGCDLSALDLSSVTISESTWNDTTRWPTGYAPPPSRAR